MPRRTARPTTSNTARRLNWFDTGGISAADSRNGNTEADGYSNFGATFNTRAHFGQDWSVDLRGYYTHGHDDFDDNFPPPLFQIADSAANNTNELFAGYAGVNATFGMLQNRVAFIATSATRDYFDSASDIVHLNYDYAGSATRLEYQGIVDFNPDKPADLRRGNRGALVPQRQFRAECAVLAGGTTRSRPHLERLCADADDACSIS